jgi:hypothetical protein
MSIRSRVFLGDHVLGYKRNGGDGNDTSSLKLEVDVFVECSYMGFWKAVVRCNPWSVVFERNVVVDGTKWRQM